MAHASAQRDLWAVGSNCLCLKVEEDHAGSGAIGDSVESHFALCRLKAAWFDQKGDSMPMLLPGLVIWKAFVREGCKAKSGVTDADVLALVGQNLSGYVNEQALSLWNHLPSSFVPMHENELMDPVSRVPFSHGLLLEQLFSPTMSLTVLFVKRKQRGVKR